ncbi:uncharacterized protein LOC141851349 [Brevipalpus obovatus]|uniref:uncharacterized protein LOC141851349 n=1 Tax=Brevipalpus obovatus TaxID=246614 RepID=UPI003D9F2E52
MNSSLLILLISVLTVSANFFSSLRSRNVEEYEGWNLMEDFDILHHLIRMRHQSPELRINVTYVLAARQRAVQWALNDGQQPPALELPVDENVHIHANPDDTVTPDDVIDVWYRQAEREYDYENPVASEANLSMLRIVSKSTQEYGCGQAKVRDGVTGIYTVCLYSPKYVPGKESENVLKPIYHFEPESDIEAATAADAATNEADSEQSK